MEKELLKNINLFDSTYTHLQVENTKVQGLNVEDVAVDNTLEIKNVELSDVSINGIEANTIIIRDSSINNATIENLEKDDLFIQNVQIDNAQLKNSDLSNGTFDNTTFKNVVFHSVDLIQTQFNNVQLESCTFINMDFSKINKAINTNMIDPIFIDTNINSNQGIQIIKNNEILNQIKDDLKINANDITQKIVEQDNDLVSKGFLSLPKQNEYLLVHDLKNEQLYQLTFKEGELVQLEPQHENFIETLKATDFNALLDREVFEIINFESDFSVNYKQYDETRLNITQFNRTFNDDFYGTLNQFDNLIELQSNLDQLYELKDLTESITPLHDDYFEKFSVVNESLKKAIQTEPNNENIEKIQSMYYTVLAQNKAMEQETHQQKAQINYLSAVINESVNDLVANSSAVKNSLKLLQITEPETINKLNYVSGLLTHEITNTLNKPLSSIEFDKLLIHNQLKSLEKQNIHLKLNSEIINDKDSQAFGKYSLWALPKVSQQLQFKLEQKMQHNSTLIQKNEHAADQVKEENTKSNDMELSR